MECDAAFYTCPSHSQRFWASGCIHISPYQTWELWNVAQPPLVCAALVHGQSLWSAQNETAAPSALFPSGWLRSVPASPAPFPSQSLSSGEGIKETNLAQVLFLTATARLQWAWNQKMPQTHTHPSKFYTTKWKVTNNVFSHFSSLSPSFLWGLGICKENRFYTHAK